MKTLFKKILSALLAVLCFGGMFAAAAETPAAEGEFGRFRRLRNMTIPERIFSRRITHSRPSREAS